MFVLASNHFRKCFSINANVWLRMKNKFFGKYFQLIMCFNGFAPKIGFIQNFHFKPFPDSRAERERERESPDHAFDFSDLRTDLRPTAFAPQTHEPISLSVWFWFFVWFWSTHESIYVSMWFWFFTFSLWSLIFLLLVWWCGWWCFGGFPVVW